VKNKKTGLERAVKSVMKSRLGDEDKFNEFNYLKDLDHPHILQVIEVIEEIRYIHMITELCTGGDLFDKIDK